MQIERHRALVLLTATEGTDLGQAPSPKLHWAPRLLALPAPLTTSPTTVPDLRVRAPWSARAAALAAEALAPTRSLADPIARLERAIEILVAAPEIAGALLSLLVVDPDDSRVRVARGADDLLNPASNAKLATATFALSALGADHRFETIASIDPNGRLYLEGSFDPTLVDESLAQIAAALRASGTTRVSGVSLDAAPLVDGNVPAGFAGYGDQDWEYLARVSALAVNKNLLRLDVRPGASVGAPAIVSSDHDCYALRSKVTTVAPGTEFKVGCDELDVSGALVRDDRGRAIIELTGTIALDYKKGKQLIMKAPEPDASFADRFAAALEGAGIKVAGPFEIGPAPAEAEVRHVHRSLPLAEILEVSIATSNAFDHEMLTLAAAQRRRGGSVSPSGAAAELQAFMRQDLGLEGAVMVNGSGIGNLDRLSASHLCRLLGQTATDPRFTAIAEALARPGQRGTLATRMLGTPAEGRLRAKTGTGEDSVALSGLIAREGKSPLVYSAIVNEPRSRIGARTFVDALGIVLASIAEQG